MSKIDIAKECQELITRFKRLKKAIEEEDSLSPAQRAAAAAARSFAQQGLRTEQLAKRVPAAVESVQAQSLAKMLQDRGILGTRPPPPRQPTDQELFGHLVPSEAAVEAAERDWGGRINNWMAEATKPLNSRFKSPEEEQAYWDNISVNDRGGSGDHGY
jgi:hypothetical protein